MSYLIDPNLIPEETALSALSRGMQGLVCTMRTYIVAASECVNSSRPRS
jgi:hypothetical protein